MSKDYNINIKIKTKYLRMFLNSLMAIITFLLGAGIIVGFVCGCIYSLSFVVFDLFHKEGINPWYLLCIIPVMAILFTCHKLLAYIPKFIIWNFKKSGKLFEKVFDAEEK